MFWQRRSNKRLFKVGATYRDEYNFPTCSIRNIDDADLRWREGRPITRPLPEIVEYELDKDLPLDDNVFTAGGPVLVSPSFWSLVEKSSSCARAYESEVFFKGEKRFSEYLSVNFEEAFECLDHQRSRFSGGRYSPDRYCGLLTKIVLAEEKIPATEQLFRLGEVPTYLLATEGFKDRVEASGLTGIDFEEWFVRRA